MPIENEGAARREGHHQPCDVLGALSRDLVEAHRRLVELHASVAIAFEEALHDEEQVRPDSLRTEIAAPHAAEERRDEEQADRRKDEEAGDVIDFLRPDLETEEIEATAGEVGEDRLVRRSWPTIPAQPGQDVVDAERCEQEEPFDRPKPAEDKLRVDLLALGVEFDGLIIFRGRRRRAAWRPPAAQVDERG